jgi:hypothetical protein
MMENMQDMWLVFIGISSGAAAGITLFKVGAARGVQDFQFILCGNIFFVIAMLSLLISEAAFFFISSGFIGAGLIFFFPMAESFYTKKMSQYQHVIPDQMGFFTGLMPAAGSLGRFLGPTIGAAMFTVAENSAKDIENKLCGLPFDNVEAQKGAYETDNFLKDLIKNATDRVADNACATCSDGPASSWSEAAMDDICFGKDKLCNFDYPAYFFKEGCQLDDAKPLLLLLFMLLANLLLLCNYFRHHRKLPPGKERQSKSMSGSTQQSDLETPIY